MVTKKINLNEIKDSKGSTNENEVEALTNLQINEAALSDPDSAILTDEELKELEKVGKKDSPRMKK